MRFTDNEVIAAHQEKCGLYNPKYTFIGTFSCCSL